MNWLALISLLLILGSLSYFRAPLMIWVIGLITTVVTLIWLDISWWLIAPTLLLTLILMVLLSPLRKRYISEPLFVWFKKALPNLSDTEQQALDAGTVWWDHELFSGKPNWKRLLDTPAPSLSDEEQAFLDGPVETLMGMLDTWQISEEMDLPEAVWQFLKDERFFSMIIPKQYGGLEFSALANSAIVMKIASRNIACAVTVMVPNSLGPGELLTHYGTEAQKDYYLPRLADGREIPCFGLTGPAAGSDAGAIPDTGVVCKGLWQGEEVLGLRLNWNKRYITLAPVASLVGLAFKVEDPDHLLSDIEDRGITCALIPSDLPGITIGRRHLPSSAAFMNGPIQGKDVFVPLDHIIGGTEQIGQGWSMLVQSLAAGRAISLPALGTAGGKFAAMTTGAYARIRRQFKMPIAYFEGVEEVLARMGGMTYRMDAARQLTLVALKIGERPSVLTAIVKYHLTEGNRVVVNDAMDVHAGKGIIQGPNNYLNLMYQTIPIAITVEGANILTRTMIIFGQGAIRAHPYLLKEMQAVGMDDARAARKHFDKALFGHIGFTISNVVRSLVMGLTGGRLIRSPVRGETAHYYRQLTRMSTVFALVSDLILLVLGGAFKFREKISGRLADILSHLYMASAVLKHHRDQGQHVEDMPLVNWSIRDSLFIIQNRLINVLRNFPIPWLGRLIRFVIFPLGMPYREPRDYLGKRVARLMISDNPTRDRLIQGIHRSQADDASGLVNQAFAAVLVAAPAEKKIKAHYNRVVSIVNYDELIERALSDEVITDTEADQIRSAQQLSHRVISVDDFAREEIEARHAEP